MTETPITILSDLWKDSERGILTPQIAICQCKLDGAWEALKVLKENANQLNSLAAASETVKAHCLEARLSLAAAVEGQGHPNGTLARAHGLQDARETVKRKLLICAEYRDLVVLNSDDVEVISVHDPLTLKFFSALSKLLAKRQNADKLLKYLERHQSLDFPLAKCIADLKSENEEQTDYEPLPSSSISVIAELDELTQVASERLFTAIQNCCQYLVIELLRSQNQSVENVVELFFSHTLVDEAYNHPLPPAQSLDGGEVASTPAQDRILSFYRAIYFLQKKPRYFKQSIQAVAVLRSKLIAFQFNEALVSGVKIIEVTDPSANTTGTSDRNICNHGSTSSKVSERAFLREENSLDSTAFLSNLLAWVTQEARNEKDFTSKFLSSLTVLKGPLGPELDEGEDLTNVNGFLEYVFTEGLLREFHQSLRHILPFKSPGFPQLEAIETTLDTLTLRKITQRVISDPLSCFDKIYLLDFYLTTLPVILEPTRGNVMATFVRYLVHLREGFFQVFKSALEARTIALQELALEDIATPSLSTPIFVVQSVEFVRALLKTFEQLAYIAKKSGQTVSPEDERVKELNDILNRTYIPIINICRHLTTRLPPDRASVLIINSYSYMMASLTSTELNLAEWCPCYQHLKVLVDEAADSLVRAQVESTLEKLGLKDVFLGGDSLSHIVSKSERDAETVGSLLRLYSAFTGASGATNLHLVNRLVSRTLRTSVRQTVRERIASIYEESWHDLLEADRVNLPIPSEVRVLMSRV